MIAICGSIAVAQEPATETQPAADTVGEIAAEPQITPTASVSEQLDETSLKQKASYIIGYNMTARWMDELKGQGVETEPAQLMEGIKAAASDQELGMTNEEVRTVMMAFQKSVEKVQIEKMSGMAKTNTTEGEVYMAENAKKEGVKSLDSGVQYEVLTEGTGESPAAEDVVRIHYHGTLPNGEVFDSSREPQGGRPAEPAEFPVNRVVPGFSAALQAMKVGDKWNVVIPGELAYGARGQGDIGPNQTLLFEIELLEIIK